MEALVREAKRNLLSLIHRVKAVEERSRVNALLANYDARVIENQKPQKVRSIVFVITRMVRFHGGQTSILRLGTQLSHAGYKVSYAVYKNQSHKEMELCAKSNLSNYAGELIESQEFHHIIHAANVDVVIATSWDTVSFVKKMHGYKMYFVQDYEPYFYPFGEQFLLAKKTYEQGLHMVSLGAWNKEMIEKNCKSTSPIDVIDFPYEKQEYPYYHRDYFKYKEKKEFTVAVYLKFYGKRLPCIIPNLLCKVKEYLKKDGITLHIKYFGEAKSFHTKGGTNLGMLSKKELLHLYQQSDFGMVASLSNISLTPYEMIATGLPLIEFKDGTFEYFFPEKSAILTSLDAKELYHQLLQVIQNPEQLKQQYERASEYMRHLSWEQTGKQFVQILESL